MELMQYSFTECSLGGHRGESSILERTWVRDVFAIQPDFFALTECRNFK